MSDSPPEVQNPSAQRVGDQRNIPFTRRIVVVGGVAATAAASVGSVYTTLPVLAGGPDPGEQDLLDFVQLSAALTGIDAQKLAPGVDPIDIKTEYFNWVMAQSPDEFRDLLTFFNSSQNKARFPTNLFETPQSNVAIGSLARSIILLWYLGAWYDPKELQNTDQTPTPQIISSKAYTQAWVWRVGQTHPMGYSDWSFGYWHDDPPPISNFIKPRAKA